MDAFPVCTMSWPQVAAILLCAGLCFGLAASRRFNASSANADGLDAPPRGFLVVAAIAFVLACGPLIGGQVLTGCQRAAAAAPGSQMAPLLNP